MDVAGTPTVRDIYGRVTTHNPYLGYFVHAPSAGNRSSRYFHESVTEEEVWQRQKQLRNRPNSGWFHPRPGSYSKLHSRYSKANTYFTRSGKVDTASITPNTLTPTSTSNPSNSSNSSNSPNSSTTTTTTTSANSDDTISTKTSPSSLFVDAVSRNHNAEQMNYVLTAKLHKASAEMNNDKHSKLFTSVGDQRKKTARLSLLRNQSGGGSVRGGNSSNNRTISNKHVETRERRCLSGDDLLVSSTFSPKVAPRKRGKLTAVSPSQLAAVASPSLSMTMTTTTNGNISPRSQLSATGFSLNNPLLHETTRKKKNGSTHSAPSIVNTNSFRVNRRVTAQSKSINFSKSVNSPQLSNGSTNITSPSPSIIVPRFQAPKSYSQHHDVIGRGYRARLSCSRAKSTSLDFSTFEPRTLLKRNRTSNSGSGSGSGNNSRDGKAIAEHNRRHFNLSFGAEPSLNSPPIASIQRDEYGRRIQSNSGSDTSSSSSVASLALKIKTSKTNATTKNRLSSTSIPPPTYIFGCVPHSSHNISPVDTSTSRQQSFGENISTHSKPSPSINNSNNSNTATTSTCSGTNSSGGTPSINHSRSTSFVISPSHHVDDSKKTSFRLSSSSSVSTNYSSKNKTSALPDGGRYAMVSGGARKAPSINQLKPWTVQTEAEINDKYIIHQDQLLGEGTYSRVYSATHRELGPNIVFAVKCIEKAYLVSEEEKQSLKREVELHLRLHHENIVHLYEVYENNSMLWLVMECTAQVKEGEGSKTLLSLCDWSGRIQSEEMVCRLIHQLLKALQYLHSNGVLHSDIKPDNIVVDHPNQVDILSKTPTIKICDFGLAKKVPNVKYFKYTRDVHKVPFTGVCGTPGYIAPELLQRQPYGTSADMWSIGIILYELISGRPPFRPASRCLDRPVAFEGIKWRSVSKEVIDLLKRLLVVDASQRLTAKDALKHDWFLKFGVGWLSEPRVM